MAKFENCWPVVHEHEGGYVLTDDPADRGGMTWCGISRKWHPEWPGWRRIDSGDRGSPELTAATNEFYRSEYWDPLRLGEIKLDEIAVDILSCAVLSGKRNAAKLTQAAAGAVVDGRIGPRSIAAINAIEPDLFELRLAMARVVRFCEIVGRRPDQARYLRGWIMRCIRDARD